VRGRRPPATRATSRVYERSAVVVAIARIRANHRCEVPGCEHPVFVCDDGRNYSEVHHIVPLGEGGEDAPGNVACVYPAHHREAHVGVKAKKIGEALNALRAEGTPYSS
jgi:predicted HNH restriction endonuclease